MSVKLLKKGAEKGREKMALKKRLGNECAYCGCKNKLMLEVDHITPTSRGGTDDKINKQVCCSVCNQLKGSLTDSEFKRYFKALQTLRELTKIQLEHVNVKLIFKPFHYPGWTPVEPENNNKPIIVPSISKVPIANPPIIKNSQQQTNQLLFNKFGELKKDIKEEFKKLEEELKGKK